MNACCVIKAHYMITCDALLTLIIVNELILNQKLERLQNNFKHLSEKISDRIEKPEHIILNNKEACDYLKVCSKTLLNWRNKGLIGYSKIGNEIFFKLSDILRMLETKYVKPFT